MSFLLLRNKHINTWRGREQRVKQPGGGGRGQGRWRSPERRGGRPWPWRVEELLSHYGSRHPFGRGAHVQPLLALAAAENPRRLQGLSAKELTHMAAPRPLWSRSSRRRARRWASCPRRRRTAPPSPVDDAAVGAALEALQAVTILARASLDADRETPTEPLEVAIELHDIIFDPDPRADVLQDAIVDLCEAWLGGRDGRDELRHPISYLVRALHANAGAADVKRLYVLPPR